jgi:hypothetical protein
VYGSPTANWFGYVQSIDYITMYTLSSNAPNRHSVIMATTKNGCNFRRVNDTTQVSMDHNHEIVIASNRSVTATLAGMSVGGEFCFFIIGDFNKTCCVELLLTNSASINLKEFQFKPFVALDE